MRKLMALLSAGVVLLSLLAGCAPASDNQTQTPTAPEATVDFTEASTFTIWSQADTNDFYSTYSDNPVIQYLNRKFNTTLDFQHPAVGSEADSLSLMLGTGEYTDMIQLDYMSVSLSELYEDGVVVNIADYLDIMPNLKARLEANEDLARSMYDDSGRILNLRALYDEPTLVWGGLAYRRDILDTMTGGNIAFPSGQSAPTTIADWEYMLPLYQQYFQAAGMENSAPFILPYTSLFAYSELTSSFGVGGSFYLEGDKVKYGPMEAGFRDYVSTMRDWYAKGWIYRDYATRTNDPVYFPNTELTYGGAAGAWFGLQSQLGEAMSMPEYGLEFDVQAVASPLNPGLGVDTVAPFSQPSRVSQSAGWAVTTATKDIPKLLTIMDYLYSDEAGLLPFGITKEMGADTDPVMAKAGLQDGTYSLTGDTFAWNPLLTFGGGDIDAGPFVNNRLVGWAQQSAANGASSDLLRDASEIWNGDSESPLRPMPAGGLDYGADESTYQANNTQIMDYSYSTIAGFITGTTELNDASWKAFQDHIVTLGGQQNVDIVQAAYDRYLARA